MNTASYSNLMTLSGLFLAFGMVMFALQAQFDMSLLCLLFAGLTDLRQDGDEMLKRLVAVCAFGFAPVVFAYFFGLKGTLSVAFLIGFLGVFAFQLANVDREYMPLTALLLPLVFTTRFFVSDECVGQIVFAAFGLMIVAMLLHFPQKRPSGLLGIGFAVLGAVYLWRLLVLIG